MLMFVTTAASLASCRQFPLVRALSVRSDYLRLDDDNLLRQCRVDLRRDSGPGGQKRNKIESAVRITHEPTNIVANAAEERSQHQNKARALKRLRKLIAYRVRTSEDWIESAANSVGEEEQSAELPDELKAILPWQGGVKQRIGKKSERRPIAEQLLLDVIDYHSGSLADSVRVVQKNLLSHRRAQARFLGGSTGQLSKVLTADDDLYGATNAVRAKHDLTPIKRKN